MVKAKRSPLSKVMKKISQTFHFQLFKTKKKTSWDSRSNSLFRRGSYILPSGKYKKKKNFFYYYCVPAYANWKHISLHFLLLGMCWQQLLPMPLIKRQTVARKKKTIFMRDLSERDGWKSATIPSAFDCLANFLFYFARISMTDDIEQKIDRKWINFRHVFQRWIAHLLHGGAWRIFVETLLNYKHVKEKRTNAEWKIMILRDLTSV